ncbi:hypothetical protein [Nitrosomonas sp.]|uniref:hypothetical protein n=1 Tax=Nitrosomonas sp. TaxID=42353 RepID=UPI0025F0DC61|nr:hypothetical protein [Nitrosomonas sp.]
MKKLVLVFMVVMLASPAFAVDVAPRISDREIIESLAELKAGQKALEAKMDLRFTAMQEQMDQRFTAVDQRLTAMQEQMDQRFEAVDRRLDFVQQLMLVTIVGIFGLIGFIIWDRYSTLRPMDMRLRRLEENLEHDLELQSPEGSKLTRMIHVLRELAKEDRKIASILRSFSLL